MANQHERTEYSGSSEVNNKIYLFLPKEPYWERLLEEGEKRNVHHFAVGDAIVNLGIAVAALGENERIALRDNAGFEEELDLMDVWYKPIHDSPVNKEIEGIIRFEVYEKNREAVLGFVEREGITTSEFAGRMFNLGLYVAFQLREGNKRIKHYIDGRDGNYEFYIRETQE